MDVPRVAIIVGRTDTSVRTTSSRVLRRAGFDVVEIPIGAEPEAVAAASPDLIVFDAGNQVGRAEQQERLKVTAQTADIPVLILSGEDLSEDARAVELQGGADAYLVKPAAPGELVANLNALLRGRHMEEAVRRSEERFRLLVGATARVMWTAAPDGAFLEAGRWADLTGQAEADALGWGWLGAVHPADKDRVEAVWREAVRRRTVYECEYRIVTRDGSYRHFMARGVPMFETDGSVREWAGICIDVHERTHAEQAQHFLADAGAVLALTLDAEEILSRVAHLAIPMLGDSCVAYLVSEDAGVHSVVQTQADLTRQEGVRELEQRYPLGHEGIRDVATVIRTGEPMLVPGAGDDSDIQSLLTVPLVARGQTLGALAFTTTRSRTGPSRRLGTADLHLALDLARRVALAVDNARLYHTALTANQAKSNFLAVMSHELRTPMNAIIGYSELIGDEVAGPLLPKQREQVERIQASSRHLLQLINEVLAFARIEAGREELHLETVDLYHLVADTASLIAPLAELKGLPLRVDVPEGVGSVQTDPGKIRQMLLNLLSNAVKFTESGEVAVSARLTSDEIVLEVRDSGTGIPAEQMQKIFDPFWQVEQSSTRRVGGTGLGLSVTRQLVRLLGGEILVDSEEGQGSTFVVRLPAGGPA